MPRKILPATVDEAVWNKVTNGHAGIRWDSVANKECEDTRRNQDEIISRCECGGYKTKVRDVM